MNIYSTAPITYAQAALGGEVKLTVQWMEKFSMQVKPGTQTDTRIRLKGQRCSVPFETRMFAAITT